MALALKIILQILTFGLAVLVATLDYWWRDARTKKHRRIKKGFVAVAILFLVVSIAVTIYDDLQNVKKEEGMRNQLQSLTAQNTGLQGQLETVKDQNIGLQKGIAVLSDTITSKESFCYIVAGVINSKITFILFTERKNPVYDVSVYFLEDSTDTDLAILQAASKPHFLGTVGFLPRVVQKTKLPPGVTRKRWRIILDTRYNTFIEDLRLVKSDGEWHLAYQLADATDELKSFYSFFMKDEGSILDVFREPEYKVHREYVDEGFPRSEIEKAPFSFDK